MKNSGKHGYRGVRRHDDTRRSRPYYARIKLNEIEHYTPGFARPHEAAIAYDVLALILHGDKAILNFESSRTIIVP